MKLDTLIWWVYVCEMQNAHANQLIQMAVKNCFIRGSVVRYVQLPAEHIDTQLLEDATRRGAFQIAPQSTLVLTSSKFQRQSIKTNDNYNRRPCKTRIYHTEIF